MTISLITGREALQDIDFTLLIVTILLVAIGVFAIFTATQTGELEGLWKKQLVAAIIGFAAMFIVMKIPLRLHFAFAYFYYLAMLLILLFLIFQGSDIGRWIDLGPFQFQPSEISKVVAVFVLARFLYDRKRDINTLWTIIGSGIIILVPFALVMLQPDLGTAMVFSFIYIALLFRAGVKPIFILILLSPFLSVICSVHWLLWALFFIGFAIILFLTEPGLKLFLFALAMNLVIGLSTPMLWNQIHDYQKNRILVFLDQSRDPFGAGYQIIQSKIAIGSGGLWGQGLLKGTQTNLAFLPTRHSDFIFPVIAEQFGFVGSVVIIILFGIILWRIVRISQLANNFFFQLTAFGIYAFLFFQIMINIGMTIGITPITGLPLPFISYGGTSLVVNLASIGLVLNILSDKQEY